ncbi:protein GET1-like [Tasmannia lanceolata]|uniref:protein GET1-like n=1 Tax=Tasmannia lanceolata TaxID=3420 RepID=UPI004063AA55
MLLFGCRIFFSRFKTSLQISMETLKNPISLAAPLIFLFVVTLQLLSRFVDRLKKTGSRNAELTQLRQEIKKILKEASSFSTPSTFAQAAKLKRMAASKERELAKIQELQNKENKGSYETVLTALGTVKVVAYLGLSWWFWGAPVATVPQQLLQPFGRVLSWRAGESLSGLVMVGMIPWLIVTTRVSKFICQRLPI